MKNRLFPLFLIFILIPGCGRIAAGPDIIPSPPVETVEIIVTTPEKLPAPPEDTAADAGEAEGSGESILFREAAEDGGDIVLAFGGDVNLADDSYVMPILRAAPGGLRDVIAGGLLQRMRDADILLLNNEFAFTTAGAALPGKEYVFRSNPENTDILAEMGADIVFLANNHVFDYGPAGLSETLRTLREANIPYIGAGEDIYEASAPVFFNVKGKKIAYTGAGCIERYGIFTPGAGENSPGIFRADERNAEALLSVIREAAASCDFVVVNMHWGVESTSAVEAYQRELGRMCIDAGADAVIGNHPHVLQGAEFYNGKPIIYSTGNFWFSRTRAYSCLAELILSGEGVTVRLVPCETGGGITALAEGEAAEQILRYYESISFDVSIDGDGIINEKNGLAG